MADLGDLQFRVEAIAGSGLTIYDRISRHDADLWIPTPQLERLLDAQMRAV